MRPGPRTVEQMRRFGRVWKQGEHVLISGSTGSGKTALNRHVIQHRLDRGGHVIVFVGKPKPDKTILEDYADFEIWRSYKKRAPSWMRKVLLWPDCRKLKGKSAILGHQKEIFQEAYDEVIDEGNRTLVTDEGLYTVSPSFLDMGDDLAMAHAVGRSNNLTLVTLTQRPSHLPLILYGSASHAFLGRTREAADQKRLAEMGAKESSKELAAKIQAQQRHDFLWVPIAPDWDAEPVNLLR